MEPIGKSGTLPNRLGSGPASVRQVVIGRLKGFLSSSVGFPSYSLCCVGRGPTGCPNRPSSVVGRSRRRCPGRLRLLTSRQWRRVEVDKQTDWGRDRGRKKDLSIRRPWVPFTHSALSQTVDTQTTREYSVPLLVPLHS